MLYKYSLRYDVWIFVPLHYCSKFFSDMFKAILTISECLSDQFRRKNQKKMSEEQYKLVAKIIEELIK